MSLKVVHIAPASKIDQEFYERVLRNMKARDRKRAEKMFGRKADKNDKNNRA